MMIGLTLDTSELLVVVMYRPPFFVVIGCGVSLMVTGYASCFVERRDVCGLDTICSHFADIG